MNDESQIIVPDSFVDLYRSARSSRLSAPRTEIVARYGFCEDLAQVLTEHAKGMLYDRGVDEDEVLSRCLLGLRSPDSGVDARESRWVVRRLAELLDWRDPGPEPAPADE